MGAANLGFAGLFKKLGQAAQENAASSAGFAKALKEPDKVGVFLRYKGLELRRALQKALAKPNN